jgi:hypothetical protein
VPIEPCQPNENVLQHCLSRLSPACTGRHQACWEPWSADTGTVELPHKCIASSCAPEQGNCLFPAFQCGRKAKAVYGMQDVSLQT